MSHTDPAANTPAANTPQGVPEDQVLAREQAAFANGQQAERTRAAGVRTALLPGHEALVEQMALDGKTTPAEASAAVILAERKTRSDAAAAHRNDAPPALDSAPAPEDKPAPDKTQQVVQAQKYAAEKKVDLVTALKALGFAA